MHARQSGLPQVLIICLTTYFTTANSFPFLRHYFGGEPSGAHQGWSAGDYTGTFTRTFDWHGPEVQSRTTTAIPQTLGVVYSTIQTDGHPSSYPSPVYIIGSSVQVTTFTTISTTTTVQPTNAQNSATILLSESSITSSGPGAASSVILSAAPFPPETAAAPSVPGAASSAIAKASSASAVASSDVAIVSSKAEAISSESLVVSSESAVLSLKPVTGAPEIVIPSSAHSVSSSIPTAVASEEVVLSFGPIPEPTEPAATIPASTIASSEQVAVSIGSTALSSEVASTSSTAEAVTQASISLSLSSISIVPNESSATNIFDAPVATNAPPAQFVARADHPVRAVGVTMDGATGTNKFYTNFMLDTQDQSVWSQPYTLAWAKGTGAASSWGLGISNTDRSSIVYGAPLVDGSAARYFAGSLYVQSIVLSASELGTDTALTTNSLELFSVNAQFATSAGQAPLISFPVVQGMGFVSALYTSATVLVQSAVFFTEVTQVGTVNGGLTYKWQITLQDSTTWLMYVTPTDATGTPPFTLQDSMNVVGPADFTGLVQIAKSDGSTCAEGVYDGAAGTYPVSADITGSVSSSTGTYALEYIRAGSSSQDLLVFALPHHVDTMSSATQASSTCVQLWTTTKGLAIAYAADTLSFEHTSIPNDIGFAPWNPTTGSIDSVSDTLKAQIIAAAERELTQNITLATDVNTAYGAGKIFGKFANLVYAVSKFGEDSTLAVDGLQNLKEAFAVWVNNVQPYPLVYDSYWGGVPSSASYVTGNSGDDYGNTYYNDHHFHYGYFVHAAAVIAHLDPGWLTEGTNKAWVNTLVRDFANPIATDPYFPQSRMFDWYHGHSWATGLFLIADGKSEESTSEDVHAAYGIKMWGFAIGDSNMEARGNLMLAVLRSSIQHYFLYDASNDVEPLAFIPNQASGIMFENKIDHTTYFGTVPEYIEGIHMIPISAVTPYIRPTAFVNQEWAYYFASDDPLYYTPGSDGVISETGVNCTANVDKGRTFQCTDPTWKALLIANYAQEDPQLAWQFFTGVTNVVGTSGFNFGWLDSGASLTYYLTYVAALGGA